MKRVWLIMAVLALFSTSAWASFPPVPGDVTPVRVSKFFDTADFYVWAENSSVYLRAVPVSGNMFVCAVDFTVIQDDVQYDYPTINVRQEGDPIFFCDNIFIPITLAIDCPPVLDCFDPDRPFVLIYKGDQNYQINVTPDGSGPPPSNLGKSGWWWNPNQSGRGIAIEIQGNTLFMAWYAYDQATGEPMWISSGGVMTDANHYTGPMWKYQNGQCIGCPYKSPDPAQTIGTLSITFHSNTTATLTCPGVNLSLERFEFGNP